MKTTNPWTILKFMILCRWTGHRLQQYLDADQNALLTPQEVHRLETHLDACARCAEGLRQYRGLHRLFASWADQTRPDPESVQRLSQLARSLPQDAR